MNTTSEKISLASINADWIKQWSKGRKEPSWVLNLRLEAFRLYEGLPWPDIKDERWKRAELSILHWDRLRFEPGESRPLAEEASSLGAEWTPLEEAVHKKPKEIKEAWSRAVALSKENKFRALTLALGNGGWCLFVPKNKRIKMPLQQYLSAGRPLTALFPLHFAVIEEGSEIHVMEDLHSPAKKELSFLSSYASFHLKPRARVSFLFLQNWDQKTIHFRFQDMIQESESRLDTVSVSLGGRVFHNESALHLTGEGAENKILGVVYGENEQNFENFITQRHTAPKTISDIQFRGALQGKAKSFFTGLVSIIKEAQQSDAYQSSKSLLLSNEARADAIPNLEILADDVKCSHGAAVGPVDKKQKYYLQTRGIPPEAAEKMLIDGFFEPVVSAVPSQTVQERVRLLIEERIKKHEEN